MARSPVSCGAKCSRFTLVTLNVIFLLCGIAFLVMGCIFKFGSDELKEDIKPSLDKVEISNYNAYDLFNGIAIIFIVAGAVIIVISFLGFVGACCTARWALYIYCIFVGLIVVVELAGVILFLIMNGEVEDALKLGLKKTIQQANDGNTDSQNSAEYMFKTYKCCHVEQTRLNNRGTAEDCKSMTSEAFGKDCYEAVSEWIRQYSTPLIVIGICVIVVQIFMIVFACCVARAYRKEELV